MMMSLLNSSCLHSHQMSVLQRPVGMLGEKEIHFVHKPLTMSMQLDNAIMLRTRNSEESFRNHIASEGKRGSNLICVASHNNKMGFE